MRIKVKIFTLFLTHLRERVISGMKSLVIVLMLIFGQLNLFAIQKSTDKATSLTQRYTYDSLAGEFLNIPQNPMGVDRLISISKESLRTDPQKAAYAAFEALNTAEYIGYEIGQSLANTTLGDLYYMFTDYIHAMEHYQLALDIELVRGDIERMAKIHNNIGSIYLQQKEYGKARDSFEKSIELAGTTDNVTIAAEALSNLAHTSYQMDHFDIALDYYNQVLRLIEGEDLQHIEMEIMAHIGKTYTALTEFHKSENYLSEAVGYFKLNGLKPEESLTRLYLANLYHKWGKYDQALDQADQAMDLAEEINNLPYIREAYLLMSNIYSDQNDPRQALLHHKHYHDLHTQLLNREREARLIQRKIQFDVAQKNREIASLSRRTELQEAVLARQQLERNLMFIGLLFTIITAVLLYRNIRVKREANRRLQKKREEIEEKNNQLIALNQEKDEFLGMASHDLRNPLAAIKGVVSLMEEDTHRDPETVELTNLIKASTERMLNLINNFLNITVSDHAVKSLSITPTDIRHPIQQVVNNFQKSADDKQIVMIVTPVTSDKLVLIDNEIMQRVLENLVSNAIKFSPRGSRIIIETNEGPDFMKVSVTDNGPGISEGDQKKMFKRFCKLSNKPTGNESSIGLGLYIVKKFTEAMGGKIYCESKPGTGTTFTVALPIAQKEPVVSEIH